MRRGWFKRVVEDVRHTRGSREIEVYLRLLGSGTMALARRRRLTADPSPIPIVVVGRARGEAARPATGAERKSVGIVGSHGAWTTHPQTNHLLPNLPTSPLAHLYNTFVKEKSKESGQSYKAVVSGHARREGMLGQRKRNHYDERWNARFKELLSYRSEHGDCNVPFKHGKLGNWVASQRAAYVANSIAQDRVDRLDSIGFRWAIRKTGPILPWETRFNELVQYKAKHGDCIVPQRQGQLGTWVSNQRFNYKEGKLSQDRVNRLNGIDFKWALVEKGPNVPWKTRFDQLVQYKTNHGNCIVPQRQGPLGNWVHTQRKAYMAGSLSQDRIDRLNGIGFNWTPPLGSPTRRKAPPSTRKQSLSRKEVSSPDTNVDSTFKGATPSRLNHLLLMAQLEGRIEPQPE